MQNQNIITLLLFIIIAFSSTLMYLYLHKKTRMNLRFVYIDNIYVIILCFLLTYISYTFLFSTFNFYLQFILSIILGGILVISIGYSMTMLRFWRTPKRKISATDSEIVSPADGNVIYIKKIEANTLPVSIKNGKLNNINELTKTDLLRTPCWLIGINMTPWDVHKNCAPVNGKIILNQHTKGKFLSLKKFESNIENERNTYVIENEKLSIGVVQIASKGVRRIDSYVSEGDSVKKGDWLGMIRFGSQVDIILPIHCAVKIALGQQIYAAKTIIASL
jgi:phosphatidylserine decarboxylase